MPTTTLNCHKLDALLLFLQPKSQCNQAQKITVMQSLILNLEKTDIKN